MHSCIHIYINCNFCTIGTERQDTLNALENIRNEIEDEDLKLKKQKEENCRRRHNYVPMGVVLMRLLASKGELFICSYVYVFMWVYM
jgi:hypothetical protein